MKEDMTSNQGIIKGLARLVQATQKAYARKWSFLASFLAVLFITTTVASVLDVLPNPPKKAVAISPMVLTASVLPSVAAAPELPTKIEIPSIDLAVTISNPDSTKVSVLDQALEHGAVRYPSSSKLGVPGNVIIFGHSSYLPLVRNQAFKAFDGIQTLTPGERITITGSAHTYVYAVERVQKASATEDAIPLTVEGSVLTLATCDSFGEKSDRFVVTARLVETRPL